MILLVSCLLLLAGCAKEQGINQVDGELVNQTFTVSVDSGAATKALADGDGSGAYVNRCIMEIYFDNQLYKRLAEPVNGVVVSFANVPVVAGKQYQILFWADCGEEESLVDKYYTTNSDNKGLKAVSIKKSVFLEALKTGNNDKLEAFCHTDNFTVPQGGGNYSATLKRPFAQVNVITTDVGEGQSIRNADMLPEKVCVSYTAANVINVATGEVAGEETYAYEAPVYGSWSTVTADHRELTLSMDYILASKDKGTVDVAFKTKNDGAVVMDHNFTNLPYQRGYRTNVKGELLSIADIWVATIVASTIDSDWSAPDILKFIEVADIKSANKIIEQYAGITDHLEVIFDAEPSDAGVPTGDPASSARAIVTTPVQQGAVLNIQVQAQNKPLYLGDYKNEYTVTGLDVIDGTAKNAVVNIIVPTNSSIAKLDVNAPSKSIRINGKVGTLTIHQGGLEIHGAVDQVVVPEDHGTIVVRDCEYLKTEVYDVLAPYIDNHYAGVSIGSFWNIVPVSVARIGTTEYHTLSEALSAAKEGEAVYIIPDELAENVSASNDNNIQLILDGKSLDGNISFTGKGTLTVRARELNLKYYDYLEFYNIGPPEIPAEGCGEITGKISADGGATVVLRENLYSGPFEGNVELRGGFYNAELSLDSIKSQTPDGIGFVVEELEEVGEQSFYYVPEVPEPYLMHLSGSDIPLSVLGYDLGISTLSPVWTVYGDGDYALRPDGGNYFPDDIYAFFINLRDGYASSPKFEYYDCWYCDFVVSYSKPVAEDYQSGIWNYYISDCSGYWLSKGATVQPFGMMKTTRGMLKYSDVVSAGLFLLGPKNLNPADAGTVITVSLNLYPDSETNKFITTNKIIYTIPEITN